MKSTTPSRRTYFEDTRTSKKVHFGILNFIFNILVLQDQIISQDRHTQKVYFIKKVYHMIVFWGVDITFNVLILLMSRKIFDYI